MFTDPKNYAFRLRDQFPLGTSVGVMVNEARRAFPLVPASFWADVVEQLCRINAGLDCPAGC